MLCKLCSSLLDLVIFDPKCQDGSKMASFSTNIKSVWTLGFQRTSLCVLLQCLLGVSTALIYALWTPVVLYTQATCNSQLSVCKISIIFPLDNKIGLHKCGLFWSYKKSIFYKMWILLFHWATYTDYVFIIVAKAKIYRIIHLWFSGSTECKP